MIYLSTVNKRTYYVYIITNYQRTVLYTGMTNDLQQRLTEHYCGMGGAFTAKYEVHYLLYYETSLYVNNMIRREKEIKGWTRAKKDALIKSFNPSLKFLNVELFGKWPPTGFTPRT